MQNPNSSLFKPWKILRKGHLRKGRIAEGAVLTHWCYRFRYITIFYFGSLGTPHGCLSLFSRRPLSLDLYVSDGPRAPGRKCCFDCSPTLISWIYIQYHILLESVGTPHGISSVSERRPLSTYQYACAGPAWRLPAKRYSAFTLVLDACVHSEAVVFDCKKNTWDVLQLPFSYPASRIYYIISNAWYMYVYIYMSMSHYAPVHVSTVFH